MTKTNVTHSLPTSPTFSRLSLGTAQFGLNYGVANQAGRPSFGTVCDMLRIAHEGGITSLDTSPSYGDSEMVIGRALKELGLRMRMMMVTKISALPVDLSPREADDRIEKSVVASLKNLDLDRLPLVLFHSEKNLAYAESLLRLRDRALIESAGISLVSPEAARRALSVPELGAWQIPSNLLDRRFTHSGLIRDARAKKITVLVRSLYLQGLLLMNDSSTPRELHEVIPDRQHLRRLAERYNLSLAELAVRGMLGHHEIISFIMGAETIDQLRQNLTLVNKGPLPAEAVAELEAFTPVNSALIINPPLWPQHLIVKA